MGDLNVMNHLREPTGLGLLGRPLLDATVTFLVGGVFGFVLSHSGALESRDHVLLYSDATEVDRNRDGAVDAWYIYRGQDLVRAMMDRNFDGKTDEWQFYEGTFLARSESDDNFDGEVDLWSTYRADNLAKWTMDTDYNGVPDYTAEFEYGIVQRARWHPNEGPVEREERYVAGVLAAEYEIHPDGSATLIRKYDSFGRQQNAE